MNKKITLLFVLFGFLFSGTDGTLRGKVADSDGAALPGTQIYMPDLGKGAIADTDGNYIILNIPVGDYEVRFLMIGYQTKIYEGVTITMDQTKWLNPKLGVATIEGDVVKVSSERALVEKGTTSKKVTVSKEAIETLPIRDVTELYNLQSGVVKIDSKAKGVPDRAEKGLEEVHVRGGRTGEIAYMIDGMYIRNPIYGGIGSGTRLNKFAIREFDWQPGGFNAEYGDAMSAVSNWHTMGGGSKYSFKFQYDTSLLGEALGSRYDELRNYHDYNFGFGGPVPFSKNKIKFWMSGQSTNKGAETVLKFDDHVYQSNPGDNLYISTLYAWYGQSCPDFDCIEWTDGGGYLPGRNDLVFPFDNTSGYKAFGFDRTDDYFTKLTYDISSQHKLTLSNWIVDAHKKLFGALWIYWDEGRQEIFRDTRRSALEFNHTINQKSFYTLRVSDFNQDQFIGVRWKDRDNDGLPDWFENSYSAGKAPISDPNNPNIVPFEFNTSNTSIYYTEKDGTGPLSWTSGWYKGAPTPGNYNWATAEAFIDNNFNGLYDGESSLDVFLTDQNPDGTYNVTEHDLDADGTWDGPQLVTKAIYRDGDYWLTPEMYVSSKSPEFVNAMGSYFENEGMYPQMTTDSFEYFNYYSDASFENEQPNPLYFKFYGDCLGVGDGTCDGFIFGGTDRLYSETTANTQELRFDYTNQATDRWRARVGFDYKTHKLDFYEITLPWEDAGAFRQRFSEQWDDTGVDGYEFINASSDQCNIPDTGEGNGTWDGPMEAINPCTGELEFYPGETFDDFNGDGKWNSYVEPEEFSMYFQNTYEVPWMVINAGVRVDAVQYNTKVWADANNNYSPYSPHFYYDCGTDVSLSNIDEEGSGVSYGGVMCPGNYYLYDTGFNSYWDADGTTNNGNVPYLATWDGKVRIYDDYDFNDDFDPTDPSNGFTTTPSSTNEDDWEHWQTLNEENANMSDNELRDEGEPTTSKVEEVNNYSRVMFKDSEWIYKVSPRIGISHVIADGATFTFNYGLYYQTPIYEFIYRNVNKLEDPLDAFQESGASIGNATMTAGRTQSYELAFNVQFSRKWACTAGVWVKDMDQLTTFDNYNSGIYEYSVSKNGDFGTAVGYDITIENRGRLFSSTIQYTYSYAKASSEYDAAAFGALEVDAPQQESLMPFDRTHDLTLSMYSTRLPWGLNGGITAFLQSGEPYTPIIFEGKDPKLDLKNKYSKRAPAMITMDISLSKGFEVGDSKFMVGANIFNLFDKPYPISIHNLTGTADNPGKYYEDNIGVEVSSQLYDRPWYYSNNREINFFVRVEFN